MNYYQVLAVAIREMQDATRRELAEMEATMRRIDGLIQWLEEFERGYDESHNGNGALRAQKESGQLQ